MKFLTVLILFAVTSQSYAQGASEPKIVVTGVNVATPLPTGLESIPTPAPSGADLIGSIFTDSKVKPILDVVYEQNKETIAKNIAIGDFFYNQGTARIDCNQGLVAFLSENKNYCAFTAVKSFGWYADLELSITVSGFLLKTEIPKSAQGREGFYFIN